MDAPGSRQSWARRTRRRRRLTALVLAALLAGTALVVEARVTGLDRLPDVATLARPLPSDTLLYDRTGTVLLADLHPPGYQHEAAPLSALGRWLPAATVAADEPGYRGPLGGATIIGRLLRLRLGAGGQDLVGRLRQAALIARARAAFSKDQLLGLYLDALPYGHGVVGARAAARFYFASEPDRLDLAQASLLAGLPQAPTALDPVRNPAAAARRQRQVLDAMVAAHLVTASEAARAGAEPVRVAEGTPPIVPSAFVQQVAAALDGRLGAGRARSSGLTVVTTLDWPLQQLAEKTVLDAVAAGRGHGVTTGALVAIDPRTGEILALVGSAGPDGPGVQYDWATTERNAGTASMVFTYVAAVASRAYTMVTPVDDAPTTVTLGPANPVYRVQNSDRRFHGVCRLQACLGNTLDAPAIQVEMATGIPQVVQAARALGAAPAQRHVLPNGSFGYTTDDAPASFGPSLTLGGYGQTVLGMATAMATLAGEGVLRAPTDVLALRGAGAPRDPGPVAGKQAVDAGVAFVVSEMLADDANRGLVYGPGTPLVLPGRHAAALVGSTDGSTDAWTMGYVPSLAAAVWLGGADFGALGPGSDPILVAAPAWHAFVQAALDRRGAGDDWYQPPADVRSSPVDGRTAYFLAGTSAATPAPPLPAGVQVSAPQ